MKIGFITWLSLVGIVVSLFSYWKVNDSETLVGLWILLVIFCGSFFIDVYCRKVEHE